MKTSTVPRRGWLAVAAPLLLLLLTCIVLASTTTASKAGTVDPATLDPSVHSFSAIQEFQQHITATSNVFVLIVFDDSSDGGTRSIWIGFISQLSHVLQNYGIDVVATGRGSELGQAIIEGYQIAGGNVILLFQGMPSSSPENPQGATKIPLPYSGEVDVVSVVQWALSSISPFAIDRIENNADLAEWFHSYSRYPSMPRVLLFQKSDQVAPGFRAMSHTLYGDVITGVITNAFGTAEKREITERYNITSPNELPALLLLEKQPMSEGNGEADVVTRMESHETLGYLTATSFVIDHIPDSFVKGMKNMEATGNSDMLMEAQRRRVYMTLEISQKAANVRQEMQRQAASRPVTVKTQEDWEKHCLRLPEKGSNCVAAFVDSSADAEAETFAFNVLYSLSVKLEETRTPGTSLKVSFVIVDRSRSSALMEYFEVGQNGLPEILLVCLGVPKTYFHYVGSFSAESILQFYLTKTSQPLKGAPGAHIFIPRAVPTIEEAVPEPPGADDIGDDGGDL